MTWRLTRAWPNPDMQRQAKWTCDMLNASVETAKMIGCSPEAIVAQAAQETGWGKAAIGNNVFGIKAGDDWKGARQFVWTWEFYPGRGNVREQCWFRDYATAAEGMLDHFKFLRDNARYADTFDRDDTMSDEEFFRRMARDGYATDPNYAANLIAVKSAVIYYESGMSRADLPPIAPPIPLLYPGGPSGDAVKIAQRALGVNETGIFDATTSVAVWAFQRSRPETGTPDGIIGPKTRKALGI